MHTRLLRGLLLALFCAPLTALPPGLSPVAAQGPATNTLLLGNLVDPPILATNLSGKPVTLSWQTSRPGIALSPARTATIPAGATDQRIDPGVTWVVGGKAEGRAKLLLDNYVYVSRVDGESYAGQAVLKTDSLESISDLRKLALRITIAADGGLALEATEE